MGKIRDMLEELLPDKTDKERDDILWSCTAYPCAGTEDEGLALYREQLEECLRERPDNPMGYASDKMAAAWERGREERERLEQQK
jgi:hypothetical protein